MDVRPPQEFAFARLEGAVNVPMADLEQWVAKDSGEGVASLLPRVGEGEEGEEGRGMVCVVCRRGNDSQIAARRLIEAGVDGVCDLRGGLHRWSDQVDASFPRY